MDIIIIPTMPGLYASHYDNDDKDIYSLRISQLTNIDYVQQYMTTYATMLDSPFWHTHGFSSTSRSVFNATQQILDEAVSLNSLIHELCTGYRQSQPFTLAQYFQPLEGIYSDVWQLVPMKGYGTYTPSFLRTYAIRLDDGTFVIADGGIKLADTIQNDPGLYPRVINKIDTTKRFLKDNDIYRRDDV